MGLLLLSGQEIPPTLRGERDSVGGAVRAVICEGLVSGDPLEAHSEPWNAALQV